MPTPASTPLSLRLHTVYASTPPIDIADAFPLQGPTPSLGLGSRVEESQVNCLRDAGPGSGVYDPKVSGLVWDPKGPGPSLRSRVSGLGSRASGLWSRVWGPQLSGQGRRSRDDRKYRALGLGSRIRKSLSRVQGPGSRVSGLGSRVSGLGSGVGIGSRGRRFSGSGQQSKSLGSRVEGLGSIVGQCRVEGLGSGRRFSGLGSKGLGSRV
eukprot:3627074-Rhodomonas_salina.3